MHYFISSMLIAASCGIFLSPRFLMLMPGISLWLGWALATLLFFLGILQLISTITHQEKKRVVVPAAFASLLLAFGLYAQIRSSTTPALAQYFQTGLRCFEPPMQLTNLIYPSWSTGNSVDNALGKSAEDVCFLMVLKDQIRELPSREGFIHLLEAETIFKNQRRLTPTNLTLILAIQAMIGMKQRQEASSNFDGMIFAESILRLVEPYESMDFYGNHDPEIVRANAEMERHFIENISKVVQKHIDGLEKKLIFRIPAAIQAGSSEEKLYELKARLAQLESRWSRFGIISKILLTQWWEAPHQVFTNKQLTHATDSF